MGRGKGKGNGHGGGGGEGGGGMLHAQRSALQATLTENVIKLQAQELQYYSGNYSMIGTMSSILAGFAFTGGLSASTAYNGWLTPWLTEVRCARRGVVASNDVLANTHKKDSLCCICHCARGPGQLGDEDDHCPLLLLVRRALIWLLPHLHARCARATKQRRRAARVCRLLARV